MSDQPPEDTPTEAPQEAPAEVPNYPADAKDEVAKGYAVYDTQLQRYVSGVTSDKPSAKVARELAPNGHRVVRV